MCIKAVEEVLHMLRYVPDHLKTQEMREKATEKWFRELCYVPDHFRTQEMCERAVEKGS